MQQVSRNGEVVKFDGVVAAVAQRRGDKYGIRLEGMEKFIDFFGVCTVGKGQLVEGEYTVKVKGENTYFNGRTVRAKADAAAEAPAVQRPFVLRNDEMRAKEKALGCAVTFSAGRTKEECVEIARYFEEEYLLTPSSPNAKVRQDHGSTARLKLIDSQTKEVIDAGSVKELVERGVLSGFKE